MKYRNGFVSNSSSSSFLIPKHLLTKDQIYNINNYMEVARKHMEDVDETPWDITDGLDYIGGTTNMDNFDMHYFLTNINNVYGDDIQWDVFDFYSRVNEKCDNKDYKYSAERNGKELWHLMNEMLTSDGFGSIVESLVKGIPHDEELTVEKYFKILKTAKKIQSELKEDGYEGWD